MLSNFVGYILTNVAATQAPAYLRILVLLLCELVGKVAWVPVSVVGLEWVLLVTVGIAWVP